MGVGRGFGKADDIALASALAKALQGEVGCSRPIAEGEGWMEHDRYIGVFRGDLRCRCLCRCRYFRANPAYGGCG